jgi:DNA-binding NarL/FixJ family response regulator|tara:strand:- start:712 stop:1332 length:621 start_codon:yes stop_codon:yes gene_type:complete
MIRVLIADHQPIVSYGIRMLFESSSDIKIVNSVNTKKQLMDYLKKGSIDVVLLSLDFADSNGITILRNIKKDFNEIRVLIFSSQAENIFAANTIKTGASGYLSKSATTATIKRAILKVFKGGIYVSNAMARKLTFEKNKEQTNLYNKLSTREIEVLNLICSGKKNNEMAVELNINPKTVSTYKTRLMKKLQVNNIIALIDLGRQKN